jgi:tRNA A37 methylthiotransferase MiaB
VSEIDPELRIRFQSPHPKDFGDELLRLVADTPNICNSLHMPAQHGSTSMLNKMKRGYTREAYISLVQRARSIIGKNVENALGLSTDMIVGFCGETDLDHQDSLALMTQVQFDQAFMYAYSKREQTYAGLFYPDDVPEGVKSSRLTQLIDTFQAVATARNTRIETGRLHVVLVEGNGKKSTADKVTWTGRTDTNKRVVFGGSKILDSFTPLDASVFRRLSGVEAQEALSTTAKRAAEVRKGMYVVVKIVSCRGHTLRAVPIARTTLVEAHNLKLFDL